MRAAASALLLSIPLCGCVPFLTPPVKGEVGPSVRALRRHGDTSAAVGLHAEAGIAPFQFAPTKIHREWDFALLGLLDTSDRDTTYGVAAEAGPVLHPWGEEATDTTSYRLLPEAQLRLLADRHGQVGWGVSVKAIIEAAGTVRAETFSTSGSQSAILGVAWGELAVGAYLDAGFESLGALHAWTVSGGLSLRLPAAAGAICCVGK